MLLTHQDAARDPNRPIAAHRHRPDLSLTIALIELRLLELPADSLRRRIIEQMIERVQN